MVAVYAGGSDPRAWGLQLPADTVLGSSETFTSYIQPENLPRITTTYPF